MSFPTGKYSVILADPPWSYKVFSAKGEGRSASQHYKTMKVADIAALPVGECAAKDCHLFLWATSPNLQNAFEIMNAWGFKYSSMAFTWIKLNPRAGGLFYMPGDKMSGKGGDFHIGMGHTTRKNAEFCLLGRRGSPKRLRKDIHEIIISPRREHSRKPDEQYERIMAYGNGPYIEFFSRTSWPGWDVYGDETGKFTEVSP